MNYAKTLRSYQRSQARHENFPEVAIPKKPSVNWFMQFI